MDKQTLRVTIVSETEFSVKGHGVHTAFLEMVRSLRNVPEVELHVNKKAAADIVHLHTFGPYALRFLLFGRAKKVVTAHVVPDSWIGSIKFARLWAPLGARYLTFFYNRADAVIAVSEEVKTTLKNMGVRTRIDVLHNTIDTSQYATNVKDKQAARQSLNIEPSQFMVVGSGQIQPRKRFDVFITLAKQLPEVRFIWVGGVPFKQLGDDYEHIQRLIKTMPSNMQTTGVIEFEKVKAYYQAANVFFLPSVQETFGLVVVEAAAAGLPVLVRDIPDYDHTFKDDVIRGTDDSFAQLIEKLRADTHFYETSKQKSLRLAARFDSRVGVEYLLQLYRSLIRR